MRRRALICALTLALVGPGAALGQQTAIVGGRVVTNGPAGIVEGGVVVIDGERIAAVGAAADVDVPPDARVVDAAGKWVTPGLFSPHAQIGLVEIDAESSTDDRAASPASAFSVALDAADDYNPLAENVGVARADGITRAALTPESGAGLFAGRGAIVDTSGAPDSVTRAPAFVAASLSEGRIDLAGGTRAAAFAYLEAALDDASAYPNLAKDTEGEVLSMRDARALSAAARGAIPLLVEADRASDLRRLAELVQAHPGLRVIVVGGAEAHLAADALAAAQIPVILDPARNLPYSFDMLAATADTAAALDAAGVDFAIATSVDIYANPGHMTQDAGLAVAHGLSWDAAFDAVTGAPARMFGLAADLGSLEPGKLADVVIWDGDPLEVMSGAEEIFIAGSPFAPRSRQSVLRDRYLAPAGADGLPAGYVKP